MKKNRQIPIWFYTLSTLFIISFVLLALLYWNIIIEKKGTIEAARIQAITAYEKDIIYRRWNADHGGVYAPVTKETLPNSYLAIPDRDIQTPGGPKFTKINPAYMTRQVHELSEKTYGVKGHITSLNPIRPENAADDWEKKALKVFEKGKKEVSSVEIIENVTYLRLMRPLITEQNCLTCHAVQGYKLGDIRGGISVSVPLSPLKEVEQKHILTLYWTYSLLWLIGIVGALTGMFILSRQIQNQIEIDKMQGMLEMAGAVCHELGQPMQVVVGALHLMSLDVQKNDPICEYIKLIDEHIGRMSIITQKLMNLTKYKTKSYLKGNIIDIDFISFLS